MSNQSDTPRTDRALCAVVPASFARQLEHELAAVTEERDAFIASARIKEANSGWRPIETAPKDGTHVILFWNGEVLSGHWWPHGPVQFGARGNWTKDRFGLGGTLHWSAPTHWMPLPAPPTTEPDQ